MKKKKILLEISFQPDLSKKSWFNFNSESVKFCLDTFYAGIVKFSVKEIKKEKL